MSRQHAQRQCCCSEGPSQARGMTSRQELHKIQPGQTQHPACERDWHPCTRTGWGVTGWGTVLLKKPGSPEGQQIYKNSNAKNTQDYISWVTVSKRIIPVQSMLTRLCLSAAFSNGFPNIRKESLGFVQEKTTTMGRGWSRSTWPGSWACSAWGTQEQHTVPKIPPGRGSQAPYGGAKLRNNRQRS